MYQINDWGHQKQSCDIQWEVQMANHFSALNSIFCNLYKRSMLLVNKQYIYIKSIPEHFYFLCEASGVVCAVDSSAYPCEALFTQIWNSQFSL